MKFGFLKDLNFVEVSKKVHFFGDINGSVLPVAYFFVHSSTAKPRTKRPLYSNTKQGNIQKR